MGRSTKDATEFSRYLAGLTTLPERRGVVAYFDLDRTLIAGYSITALALEKMWSGSLSPKRILAHAGIFLHWGLGRSDYHQLLESTVAALVGMSEAEIATLGEQAFERRLKPLIYGEGRQLIEAHKAAGHEVVIVTSATGYQAWPVARCLGVEQMFCTELEIEAGTITGGVTPCYGPGKKAAAVEHAAAVDADLADAYFYTDSCEDLPLLEEVGHPVAVNAKTSLGRIAAQRGWPQIVFETLKGSTATPAIAA
jgi:putative phosphoserine phosphatase/1-acylglycerol-3-phosphate O-acyltransferase